MPVKARKRSLVNGTIRITKNLVIDDKLRVGGVLYLEERYDASLELIVQKMQRGRTGDGVNILVALAMQRGLVEGDVRKEISNMDVDEITEAIKKLDKVFDIVVKEKKVQSPMTKKTKKKKRR